MKKFIYILLIAIGSPALLLAQTEAFSLDNCIEYALNNSTDIERSKNNISLQQAYLKQSKASYLPNLQFEANQQYSSSNDYSNTSSSWNRNSNSSTSAYLSSQVSIYNGAKTKNTISQNKINLKSAEVSIQAEKELISLNILSSYIDALLAKENVQNYELQLEATKKQLTYAEAKKEAGTISRSDLLYIKSQLATDKTNYIEAKSNLRIALVSLMQLMNMPINDNFSIEQNNIESLINKKNETNPETIYNIALGIQANIQTAELSVKSAEVDIKIAKAGALPNLSLNAGIGTGYGSSLSELNFQNQFSNNINPYVGLSLSIPIYQQRQVKTQVKQAQIQTRNAKLDLVDMQNQLRKYIEQACTDAQTAQSNYTALKEQLESEQESYNVANEMFIHGLLNSVDFLVSKNNLIIAQNKFTQAKYKLILQNEIIEYYLGETIQL